MTDEKEKKVNKGVRKTKKPKSNENKTSTSKGGAKPKRRKAGNRIAAVKPSEDEVAKKPETRVKRTRNNRRTVRGRKAALNKTADAALNDSIGTLNTSTSKISTRRVAADRRRNVNKSKGVNSLTKSPRPTRRNKKVNTNEANNAKGTTKKTAKANKTKVIADKNLCSVCKEAESTLGGMCSHNFCFKCFKNLISKKLETSEPIVENHLNAPTMGKCPKCPGCEVKKFEMRVYKDGKITDQLAFEAHKQTSIKKTRLAGKVFCPSKGNDPKFCFDEDKPYIDVTDCVDADMDNWVLNDGYPVPDRLAFEEGCFFDEDTRTFHGKVKWPVTFRGAYQWDVVLAFKKNYKAMDVGIIHERKERVLDEDVLIAVKELLPADSEEEIVRLQYPFDGDWELTWRNADNQEKIAKVTVRNNQFQREQYLFNLDMSDPSNVLFRWPGALYTANITSGANLSENPKGPEIGEMVSWKTMHPDFPEGFTWERLTIGELPIPETLQFGTGNNKYVAKTGRELVSRKSTMTTLDESENFSESHHDDASEPGKNEDSNFLSGIMAASSVPVYYDYDFGMLSLNKYDTPGRVYSDDSDKTNSRNSLAQDPLFRDLFAS